MRLVRERGGPVEGKSESTAPTWLRGEALSVWWRFLKRTAAQGRSDSWDWTPVEKIVVENDGGVDSLMETGAVDVPFVDVDVEQLGHGCEQGVVATTSLRCWTR